MSSPTAPTQDSPVRRLVPLVVAGGRTRWPDTVSLTGRVAIISATVGQGHEGAARELARRLVARGVQVEVHDYLDALPAPARHVLRDLYQPTVQYATALREQGRITAPAVTYLTDPAAHATWCHPAVDHHLTVTEATARDAGRYGVRARASGPLSARDFAAPTRARSAVREELGLPADAPVALISAGSLGMGSVPRTVRDLLVNPRVRVVVLCGRNTTLRRRLGRLERVVALGWRDDVSALMAAADVLIHNAGGLSLTEALATGLPAVTYRPIAGHGRANAEVLDRAGIAPWPRSASALAAAVEEATNARGNERFWPLGADPAALVQGILTAQRTPGLVAGSR